MRKFRFLISTVVLSVLGLFLASCSIGGNIQQMKLYKIVEGAGTEYTLTYNSDNDYQDANSYRNYQILIPLKDIIGSDRLLVPGDVLDLNLYMVAEDDFTAIDAYLLSTGSSVSGDWKHISDNYKIRENSWVNKGELIVENIHYEIKDNYFSSECSLVLCSGLRSWESWGTENHAAGIKAKIYFDPNVKYLGNYIPARTNWHNNDAMNFTYIDKPGNYYFEVKPGKNYQIFWIDTNYYNVSGSTGWAQSVEGVESWTLTDCGFKINDYYHGYSNISNDAYVAIWLGSINGPGLYYLDIYPNQASDNTGCAICICEYQF